MVYNSYLDKMEVFIEFYSYQNSYHSYYMSLPYCKSKQNCIYRMILNCTAAIYGDGAFPSELGPTMSHLGMTRMGGQDQRRPTVGIHLGFHGVAEFSWGDFR